MFFVCLFFWVFQFLFLMYSPRQSAYTPGCWTEEQRWCSDPTLINGVCCLWLSCQQITPCAKINLISCVGPWGWVAWLRQQRLELKRPPPEREQGLELRPGSWPGWAQRGRRRRATEDRRLLKMFWPSAFPTRLHFCFRWLKTLLFQIGNKRLLAFSFCC